MRRVVSGSVLVAVVLVVLWHLPPWSTAVAAALVSALGGWELARLAARESAGVPASYVGLAAAAVMAAGVAETASWPGVPPHLLQSTLLGLVVLSGLVAVLLGRPGPGAFAGVAVLIMGPLYVGLPLAAIASIQLTAGPRATTWLLGLIAVSDTVQYYAGRRLGRTKLSPRISPSKTVEGALGGLVAAAVLGLAIGPGLPAVSRPLAAVIAIALSLAGMAGDLFESLLKRSVGAKDSSALIPGHGGVLDRIDSYLFAAPVFFLVMRCLR